MILKHVAGSKRIIASLMLVVLYFETVIPSYALATPVRVTRLKPSPAPLAFKAVSKPSIPAKAESRLSTPAKAFIGGPTQPESQAFHSVNSDKMVDLFTGDFSYSIPLLDVGGYPLALGYNSGVGMSDDASWVGLGWNLNPGSITRNLRGLPDDFSGEDTITKVAAIKPNKTRGLTLGASIELLGLPLEKMTDAAASLNVSAGVVYNNYKGWGVEAGVSPSLNVGSAGMGSLTAGLSVTNSSMDGVTISPSLDYKFGLESNQNGSSQTGSVGLGTGYNSRSGLKSLELQTGVSQTNTIKKSLKSGGSTGSSNTLASFAYPSYLPSPSLAYTSTNLTLAVKTGIEIMGTNTTISLEGYSATQEIKAADQKRVLPAYGYLNYQKAGNNTAVLLDFNREKDIPYRETPHVPNIGVPAYTYDVFGVTGEGVSGSFRAYRSEVGHVFDHYNKTKSGSLSASVDLGSLNILHAGANVGLTYAYTETGPWGRNNFMAAKTAFSSSAGTYEASYLRNPGEMTVNDKDYYKNLGDDDVVAVKLYHAGASDPALLATATMNKYNNSTLTGTQAIETRTYNKNARDKRTQVISYLTAEEASVVGFPKYIENYSENSFSADACPTEINDNLDSVGVGLQGEYFINKNFENKLYEKVDTVVNMLNQTIFNYGRPSTVSQLNTNFSVRWTGRIKAPVTGTYTFYTQGDDGIRLFLNDTNLIYHWTDHPNALDSAKVNLVAGEFYDVRMEYFNGVAQMVATLEWKYPGQSRVRIPTSTLFLRPAKDTLLTGNVSIEKRVNDFRLKNHISEIDVLNTNGQRYVYGIPVYNLQQKEATFSVQQKNGNATTGLVAYTPGTENTVNNTSGNDHYFSSDLTPAYAHTFLLTGVLSPDYKDLTGNGITADDPGTAVKFNYTKIAGFKNPSTWRIPLGVNKANYNAGMRTDNRDDKGSYVYGQKELWYLNSVESKTMIAVFRLSKRNDLPTFDENGVKTAGNARKLDRIDLYTKAEFTKANPKPTKSVHFEYSYDLCKDDSLGNGGKLTLTKVWFTYNGNNSGKRHPYVFNYNAHNPYYNAKNVDRWGTYKSNRQNPSMMDNNDYPYAIQDRDTAAKNAAAWTLDSITLPSGGRIKVDYEGDDYAFVQNKRAAQMFTIAGFSATEPSSLSDIGSDLYRVGIDYQYVSVNVPKAVSSKAEVYDRYLAGMSKIFFRLYVKMPSDSYGSGNEYIPCYATLDPDNYGYYNDGKTIWFRVKAISKSGETDMATSIYSPMAQAAINYLRLNLPSKAYPGSETGDDIDAVEMLKILATQADNYINMLASFTVASRVKGWAKSVDVAHSFVRLTNPVLKKYGGGVRVKRVTVYDHWNAMTKQKESLYGQEYIYNTTYTVNGKVDTISSGVAIYEPMIGGEENPWRQPLEYTEQVAALAPVSNGYTETPLGEAFFPSPSVGYSKVRVRSINAKNTRSANGYTETCFYTAYDFPTLVDMSVIDKIRFKPALANLLRINSRHYLAVSQGFKVELNDMHGKKKSEGTYSETDPVTPVTYSEQYYRVDNQQATFKHLNNTVMAMKPDGTIDTTAVIGKDMELMMDMREQRSLTTAYDMQINGDMITFVIPPFLLLPMLLNLYHREETIYRSAGVSKVINRHGVLDSIVATDKGSKVITRNLLYDAESGNPILNSTQNEYGDPLYTFTLPAGWAYDGLSGAYKNIDVVLDGIYIKQGRITSGLPANSKVSDYFAAGDKVLIYSKLKTGGTDCAPEIATFPVKSSIYAVAANAGIYFVDEDGQPFTGNDISLKVVQSGRKNMDASLEQVTLLNDPRVKNANGNYSLVLDNTSKVIAASAVKYDDHWKVADSRKSRTVAACVTEADPYGTTGCTGKPYGNERHVYATFPWCTNGQNWLWTVPYITPANTLFSYAGVDYANMQAIFNGLYLSPNYQDYADANGICLDMTTATTTTASVAARKAVVQTVATTVAVDSVEIKVSVGVGDAMIRFQSESGAAATIMKSSGTVTIKVPAEGVTNIKVIAGESAVKATIGTLGTFTMRPKSIRTFMITPTENTEISIVNP